MALYSEVELDVKAKATVFSLDRNLEHASIVRQIGEQYTRLCDSPEAKKLSIKSREITEGAQLRLLFEALCFTSFLTFQIIPKYVSTRKLIRKKINHQLVFCPRNNLTNISPRAILSQTVNEEATDAGTSLATNYRDTKRASTT